MLPDLLLIPVLRRLIEPHSLHSVRQVLLGDIVVRVVVGILVAETMSKLFSALVVPVLKMGRYPAWSRVSATVFIAFAIPMYAALLFGAVAT